MSNQTEQRRGVWEGIKHQYVDTAAAEATNDDVLHLHNPGCLEGWLV